MATTLGLCRPRAPLDSWRLLSSGRDDNGVRRTIWKSLLKSGHRGSGVLISWRWFFLSLAKLKYVRYLRLRRVWQSMMDEILCDIIYKSEGMFPLW